MAIKCKHCLSKSEKNQNAVLQKLLCNMTKRCSKRYEPRSRFYAVRHLYQINFSASPDGKLRNKAEMPIKRTIKNNMK